MKPHTSYVICAVQRSGSFLLCEALKNTSLAGFPEEYFLNGEGWEDGEWARKNGVTTRSDYLRLVFDTGTSPNGVFGTKIMWNYFPLVLERLKELPEYRGWNAPQLMVDLFPNLHYIWIDLYNLILEGEAGWQTFFEACGVQPFKVVYEELVEAYEETALRILDYLNIPFPKDLIFGERRLQKQADTLNERWVEKYTAMKQQASMDA